MKITGINTYKNFINVGFSRHKDIETNKGKHNKSPYSSVIIATSLVAGSLAALAVYNYVKKGRVSAMSGSNFIENTPSKFLTACKNAVEYNYCSSSKNIAEGRFTRDLHSHSNHSDGYGKVSDILNQVCAYADELFKKTGKKFTFALTDHDRVSGVKEALDIIKKNPEKYKNVNFIPGVELSFSFISDNKVKSGELLAYFINPEAQSIKTLVEKLNQNRNKMIDNCIQKLGEGFSRQDLEKYFLNKDGETFAYNLHYRLRNYAQIKNRINNIAKEQCCNSGDLYKRLMDGYVFDSGKRVPKPFVSPEGFDDYLKKPE